MKRPEADIEESVHSLKSLTRRHFLSSVGGGLGAMALGQLFCSDGFAGEEWALQQLPHYAPKAKRVIVLHMAGAPPQHDLFDPKPTLSSLDGQPCPDSLIDGERFAFIRGHPKILASPYKFAAHGESQMEVSELLPHFSRIVDEVCMVRSMRTDQFNHAPAQLFLYSGSPRLGRPSMGAWTTWGLGSENRDLPGFVVLVSGGKTPSAGKSVWGSGFLPSIHQGVQCRSKGDPFLYVGNPPGIDRASRRRALDALAELNEQETQRVGDPKTLERIEQYELAYRMQISVPGVMEISHETPEMLAEYGATPGEASFANNCLLARRLVESGVRFVQLFDWGWDIHGTGPNDDLITQLPRKCRETDRPIAALITDLKRRGLLEDTLVIWTGEFGRTAMNEERNGSKFLGRDHHPHCFTIWMAGGGVKAGYVHGETDELGCRIEKGEIGVHDLQATVLHLLGFDHTRLTFPFQGRRYRLTDVHGRIASELLT